MSSYPKRIKSAWQRSSRPRKKNPSLFSKKSSEKTDEPVGQSTSAKKLESASSEDVHWNPLHGYRFIEFFTVFTALSELVICRECKQNLNLKKLEIEVSDSSLFYFVVVAEEILCYIL